MCLDLVLVLGSQNVGWVPLVGDSVVEVCNAALHEVHSHEKNPHVTSSLDSHNKDPKTDGVGPLSGEAQASTWKGALVGNPKTVLSTQLSMVTVGEDGPEICLPDNVMDNIASSLHLCLVGRFLAFRPTIDMKSKLVYDRLCVNVVINNPLPNFISLKSKWGKWTQAIVYENASLYCQRCRKHGHVIANCLVPPPPEAKQKEKLSSPRIVNEDSMLNVPP
ncbi:hypothetical protein SUGI_0257960 [Cryptomeria japonica]|nr:hypothetical protein SUGI_0257960 [Cryptomeria japonica]